MVYVHISLWRIRTAGNKFDQNNNKDCNKALNCPGYGGRPCLFTNSCLFTWNQFLTSNMYPNPIPLPLLYVSCLNLSIYLYLGVYPEGWSEFPPSSATQEKIIKENTVFRKLD